MINLQGFKLFLVRKGLKPGTVNGDIDLIKRMLKTSSFDKTDSYLLSMIERGCKHSYLNSIVKALRNYGQFVDSEELKSIPFFKTQSTEKSTMRDQEINDFLALPPASTLGGEYLWHYNKMVVFWKCLAYSGARTSEIANLTIDDVDFGASVFRVDGKMGKRNVPISLVLFEPLRTHMKLLKSKLLFPAMRNERSIERATWDYDFRQRIKKLGIKRENLTPYSLRHSFITRNWKAFTLPELQKIAGHKRIQTTLDYTHLVTEDIVEAIKKDRLSRKYLDPVEFIKLVKDAIIACGIDSERFNYKITDEGMKLLFEMEYKDNHQN